MGVFRSVAKRFSIALFIFLSFGFANSSISINASVLRTLSSYTLGRWYCQAGIGDGCEGQTFCVIVFDLVIRQKY